MNTLVWCGFIAALLPFLAKVPLAIAMHKTGRYDNNHPRDQQAQLTGFGARALAAHQNSFESLIIFGLAIGMALATNTITEHIELLAMAHIVARVIYCVMYYINQGILRSLSWFVSIYCSFALMWQILS